MGRVFFNTRENIQHLDGAYTMLPSDSGTIFVLNAAKFLLPFLGGVAMLQDALNKL